MAKKDKMEIVKDPAEVEKMNQEREARSMVLFSAPEGLDTTNEKKFQRRNMPQIIKPGDVPVGGMVSGEIIDAVNSPSTVVKGKCLWIKHASGTEFLFPVTGVIRQALLGGTGLEGDELTKALQREIGTTIICKRLESKQNSKFKKEMFMFDVFTSKK